MLLLTLLLASNLQSGNLWAQSATQPTPPEDKLDQPIDQSQVNNTNLPGKNVVGVLLQNKTSEQVRRLMSGRPTITGFPNFLGGIKVSSITFANDNTIQNTALTGQNTFSSINVYGSTDTVTGSTHTLSGSACINFPCSLLTLNNIAAAKILSIAGLPANSHIQMEASSVTWVTGTNLLLEAYVNGEVGANYNYWGTQHIPGGDQTCSSSTGQALWQLQCAGASGTTAGSAIDFMVDLWTTTNGASTGQTVTNESSVRYYNTGNTRYEKDMTRIAHIQVSTAINQITFFNSGGTNFTVGKFIVRLLN